MQLARHLDTEFNLDKARVMVLDPDVGLNDMFYASAIASSISRTCPVADSNNRLSTGHPN
jgi:hypothetical protein